MSAICVFTNNINNKIKGNVIFKETLRGLQIKISISGLTPGLHGFHIHETGDLTDNCSSLCSHFNPTNSVHGGRDSKERHLGDLGNIKVDKKGSPQRMGIFQTKKDSLNFLYDVLLGIRSHKERRSKLRPIARILPTNNWRRKYIKLIHKTRIKTERK